MSQSLCRRLFHAHGLLIATVVAPLLVLATVPALDRLLARRAVTRRLDRGGVIALDDGDELAVRTGTTSMLLESWRSVGGCGAGSATGIGGIKWIGRNVTGGLFHVQTQGNYTHLGDGYSFALQNLITTDLGQKWNVGVMVPFLYKYLSNYDLQGYDLSNGGVGDVNLLVSRRFGAINDTTLTLSVGAPTGTHDAHCQLEQLEGKRVLVSCLPQDRQLGAGSLSGGVLLEHTVDNISGPLIYGAAFAYPGAANAELNYRAPSLTAYLYRGWLVGPLVPALGLSLTQFTGHDRDVGFATDRPMSPMAAANGSIEWATDWVALLAGVSFPVSSRGREPWTVGLGAAFAPF
jgi:hypothetical protein